MLEHINNTIESDLEIGLLIAKHLRGELDSTETMRLNEWLADPVNNATFQEVTDKEYVLRELAAINRVIEKKTRLKARLDERLDQQPTADGKVRWHNWGLYVAAASVVFVVVIVAFLQYYSSRDSKIINGQTVKVQDASPGKFKARLVLDDGSTIVLDSSGNGELARQGNTSIIQKDGQLLYQEDKKGGNALLYNKLTTGRGETYCTLLSDGSKIWLNAGSSVRYPVTFPAGERKIEITGEAYFQVAKDANKPFVVSGSASNGKKWSLQVLGTSFNLNNYLDEPVMKTTLVEGSVKIMAASKEVKLQAGEQAILNGYTLSTEKGDVEAATAWKNGYFQFTDADLPSVLRQLSRWYDLDVIYVGQPVKKTFAGKLPLNARASEVLSVLAAHGIHLRIEGKKLMVSQ